MISLVSVLLLRTVSAAGCDSNFYSCLVDPGEEISIVAYGSMVVNEIFIQEKRAEKTKCSDSAPFVDQKSNFQCADGTWCTSGKKCVADVCEEPVEHCAPQFYQLTGSNAGEPFVKNKNDPDKCPYGKLYPGGVTLPNNPTIVDHISVWIYGYVPFVAPIYFLIKPAIYRGTRDIANLIGLGLVWAFHVPFKKWICTDSYRPGTRVPEIVWHSTTDPKRPKVRVRGTCKHDCGMPSGHSTVAFGAFTLLVWDLFEQEFDRRSGTRMVAFAKLFLITILFAPVPISRVILFDHTVMQAAAGTVLGATLATVWILSTQAIAMIPAVRDSCRNQTTVLRFFTQNICPTIFWGARSRISRPRYNGRLTSTATTA